MKKKTAANLFMLLGSIIWGAAFVAQSIGARYLGPFAFGAIRFLLGSLVLLPVMYFLKRRAPEQKEADAPLSEYIKAGGICGVALFAGATLQQYGLMYSTASNAGFVTALYIVLVPIFGFIFLRRKLERKVIAAIAVATVGVYFLCINSQFSVNKGDALTMMGSVCWAVQILCLERFSQKLDGIKFALFEFLTCSALSGIMMFIVERPSWQSIYAAALPLLYCGLLSVGVGFTAQIICVKYTDPVVASLIMSTESVFAAMLGWLVLGEHLSARQLFGGVLVFFAVILTQLPPRRRVKPRTTE